jgi:hypothetical protein
MFTDRTEIILNKFQNPITHKDKLFFIGSCFSNNIGNLVRDDKFNCIINPFGVQYNPASVLHSLNFIFEKKYFEYGDLLKNGNLWCSLYHHSSFSSTQQNIVLEKINNSIDESNPFLKSAGFLFITFGTARVYKFNDTGEIVANCHKFNSNDFIRETLSVNEIVFSYEKFIKTILIQNEDLNIIFTISPVRHLKDGFSENSESKAILHLAVKEIVRKFQNCHYFPAYEIFMDDLRDYRYYDADLIHPGEQGINYLFNKFSNVFYSKDSLNLVDEIRKIKKAVKHKPLTDDIQAINAFVELQKKKIQLIEKKYMIDFSEELNSLENITIKK